MEPPSLFLHRGTTDSGQNQHLRRNTTILPPQVTLMMQFRHILHLTTYLRFEPACHWSRCQ